MNRVRLHNAPVVIVKTGGLSAGVTAIGTVGIFAVATITAVHVANVVDEIRTKVDKFLGTEVTPEKEPSKELVKDTIRSKTKRFIAKSFLKNLFK